MVALGDLKDDRAAGFHGNGGAGVAQGQFGGVVFFGQMREPNGVRAVAEGVFTEQGDSGFIGKVAVIAEDAGFEGPG